MKTKFGSYISLVFLILFGGNFIPSLGAGYETGLITARQIGNDLWDAMDLEDQGLFPRDVVAMVEDTKPWINPVLIRNGRDTERRIAMSQGFIDLVNNVSHAKAIDKFERGFFDSYLNQLANESGKFPLRDIPNINAREHWTDEILNEQQSNFNQMIAFVLAVQLSHHTLGHFDRHSAELKKAHYAQSINNLLTTGEWNASFQAGMETSLAAGYGVEGFEVLCEALRRMPQHPPWTNFVLPKTINLFRLQLDLERSEHEFFYPFP